MNASAPPIATSSFSIFVVEDEVLTRMALGAALRDHGFTVYELHDADETLAVIEAGNEPDALVTDIMMPGSIDGLRLAVYLETMFPAIKIFVTSGHIAAPEFQLPMKFFAKPYDPSFVAREIKTTLMRPM